MPTTPQGWHPRLPFPHGVPLGTLATPARTIMVFRFSALGDILLTTPALHALKQAWPDARIIFVTKAGFVPLLKDNPLFHHVVGVDAAESFGALRSRLAALHPDVVLDLHGKTRSKLLRHALGASRVVAWTKRRWQDTLPVKLRLRPYKAEMLLAQRFHHAVEELVGRSLGEGQLQHHVSATDREAARAIMLAAGVDFSRPVVGMSPGANWKTKQWPAEHYRDLAAQLAVRGVQTVLTGSAAEQALGAVVAQAGPLVFDLSGKLDIPLLGGAISLCTAFVANDSGPMHMARGLGIPTLAIFGSTDPGQFDFTGHAHLFAGLECSPCSFYGLAACPKGHLNCLKDIPAQDALVAIGPLLQGGVRPLVRG